MRLHAVGDNATSVDPIYGTPDWHLRLSPQQLAAYVRYLFIALKENAYDVDSPAHNRKRFKWDGGTDAYGVKHKRVWNRIASAIRHADAVPGTWVAAHFAPTFYSVRAASNKSSVDNRPELLCSDVSIDAYQKYLEVFAFLTNERCAAAEISVGSQLRMLQDVIKNQDDRVFYIVADKTNVNATPFFRHAFSALLECPRGVARYLAPAALEYDMNQQLYDAMTAKPDNVWWVSEELKHTVAHNRRHWSSVYE
jgi:hypothetical protein